ncbi:MAG: phosphoketolase family protein [Bacilli bacterium]|nr:phosphoketolase family protein [Bacilli bacterium]
MENKEYLEKMKKYFAAANYLSVAQLYLLDNPLLERPLKREDVKRKIVGHFGTVPGQNFIYVHLNRIIKKYDLNMIYISGPGHGGNALVSNTYLEGTYSEVFPNITQDKEGLKKLFKQFSFPGGISSHVAPEVPGSIHEGGELGYSLAHAYGAVLDNPNLIAACVVGDGEAETGPLATSWHGNKFINPKKDGMVLPILHLNGYKISNPTIFARISETEMLHFFVGCGYKPYIVDYNKCDDIHEVMADTLDKVMLDLKNIKQNALTSDERPIWPMIILKTPKGWTGPKIVDEKEIEGTFRAHQVPVNMEKEEHLKILEDWLLSYHPHDLFDENGKLIPELQELAPTGNRRMGSNPHANGGILRRDLVMPDFRNYAFNTEEHGKYEASDMMNLGAFIRDIIAANPNNFRLFGPDETLSNRLNKVFEKTNRTWNANKIDNDEFLASDGRVMDSMLSEHMCEGMLEGYLLTGRHGIFASYEAFIRVVDSMFSQHAKWLKVTNDISWRYDIASLNYILTSNVWQQDHNGFTHQDPGFMDHVANKKADVVRIYLPPDTNTLLSVVDHCVKSKSYVNVIVASKHLRPQWLTMDEAIKHCTEGIGIWDFASTDQGGEPDVVMASCGETPTLEALAAVTILKEHIPGIKIRFINVVDLMKLEPSYIHPHGMTDDEFDLMFTKDKPIIFNFHGYKTLIHELLYHRHNRNLHVNGYIEEGTITTPFDMRVQNEIDRYHLVLEVLKYTNFKEAAHLSQLMKDKLVEHKEYIHEYGVDMPEVANWKWQ